MGQCYGEFLQIAVIFSKVFLCQNTICHLFAMSNMWVKAQGMCVCLDVCFCRILLMFYIYTTGKLDMKYILYLQVPFSWLHHPSVEQWTLTCFIRNFIFRAGNTNKTARCHSVLPESSEARTTICTAHRGWHLRRN